MKFLFDLGGVFFDWDPNHFYKEIIKNNKGYTATYLSKEYN